MNSKSLLLASQCFLLITPLLLAGDKTGFDTGWISSKPEILTYRSHAAQGDGLYQVSVWRGADGIEIYMNIISPGFAKSVWGRMTGDMHPVESRSRILVNGQITMTTDCSYGADNLHIATLMSPGNKVMENTLNFSNRVMDFSQAPLLARTLALKPGAKFTLSSLNPQNNSLIPLTLHVVGTETIQGLECYQVEARDFEGDAKLWIEKTGQHRVLRIEQAETGRISELIL